MGGLAGSISIATENAGWPWRIEVDGSYIGLREEEDTNDTDVDVQGRGGIQKGEPRVDDRFKIESASS